MGLHFSVISGVEHSSIYSKNRTSFNMGKGEKLGFAENFMLSGVAAAVSKTAAAPIERVKLLVQNQGEMLKQGTLTEPYKGVLDCTSRTMKNEGLASFWRGNLANVIRYFPTRALNFAFKDTVKALFKTAKDAPQYEKFGKNILSGGCAGSMSLFFVYSLDYCRTRLANDAKTKSGTRQYNGMIDVYVKTIKSDGIQGLYRGFVISCVGIFIYRGMYFGLYDSIKPIVLGDNASVFLLHPGLDRHRDRRPHVLPHRHHPSAYDDDLRTGRQVQGIRGLRRPGPQERRLHVADEGRRRQHPPWCGRRRCPRRIRQVQGAVHPVEDGLSHVAVYNFNFTKHDQTRVIIN